jgi:hypothetical protein
MKVSRRGLAKTIVAGAAVATLPAQAPPAAVPEAEVAQARAQLRNAASIVHSLPLPMATEPATRFVPRT